MRKTITIIGFGVLILVVGFYALNAYIYNEKQGDMEYVDVKLYYYNPSLDQGEGGVQCTRKGLVPVNRSLPKTDTLLEDTISLLIMGELTDEEKANGLTTEFPLDGFGLIGSNFTDESATLEFSDPLNKTVGGSCRVAILWAQIDETSKQFQNVKQVKFFPEELFQP